MEQEGCPLICRFATMGTVRSIRHSQIGTNAADVSEEAEQMVSYGHELQTVLFITKQSRILTTLCSRGLPSDH